MKKAKQKSRRTPKNLDPKKFRAKIQNVRQIVESRMKAKGWSVYRLAAAAREAGGKMTEQTVRNFLKGSTLRSDHLEVLLAVLDLEVAMKR